MTVRDAIRLAIPVFAAHPRGGPSEYCGQAPGGWMR